MSNWDEAVTANATWISEREMHTISKMHDVAQKYDFSLTCSRCERPFQGFNAEGDRVLMIECGCRVLKAPASKAM